MNVTQCWLRPRLAAFTVVAAITILVAGCSLPSGVARDGLERRYYMLDPLRPGSMQRADLKSILKVRPFSVSPGFETNEFIYKVSEQRFETDYYNLFFMLPGPSVTQAARKWLEVSGLFGHVVDSTSQVEETHVLEGNLVAAYGDFTEVQRPKAIMEMQFVLLKENKAGYEVIFQKNYRQEELLLGKGPKNLAAGMQKSLGVILAALESDLREVGVK